MFGKMVMRLKSSLGVDENNIFFPMLASEQSKLFWAQPQWIASAEWGVGSGELNFRRVFFLFSSGNSMHRHKPSVLGPQQSTSLRRSVGRPNTSASSLRCTAARAGRWTLCTGTRWVMWITDQIFRWLTFVVN